MAKSESPLSNATPEDPNGVHDNSRPTHDRNEFLWKVHQYLQDHARFSDAKCGVVIGLATGVLATLYSVGLHSRISSSTWVAAAFALLALSIGLAGWSIRPRLWRSRPDRPGYVFWEDILKHDTGNAFATDLQAQNPKSLYDYLANQVFIVARVCSAKYFWFGWAFACMMVGGVLGGYATIRVGDVSLGEQPGPTIGLVLPLTGSLSFMGQPERNGFELAMSDYQRNGTAKYKNAKLVIEDSQSTSRNAVTATQKLLQVDRPVAVIISNTGPNLAIAPITEGRDVLHIAFCMEPDIQRQHEKVFRLYESATQEGNAILEYLKSKRDDLKKIGFLYIDQPNFVKTVEQVILPGLEAESGPSVVLRRYRLDQQSYREVLLKLQDEGIDALVLLGYGSEYRLIFDQLKELGILGSFEIVGGWGFLYPQVSPTLLEGVRVAAPLSAISDEVISRDFRDRYREQYGALPNFDAAYAYSTVKILMDAMDRSETIAADEIARQIEGRQFDTPVGNIRVTNRELIVPMGMAVYENGHLTALDLTITD